MNNPSIFVVSGGTGSSGSQTVQTALAQFDRVEVEVVVIPQVRTVDQVTETVRQARAMGALVVHTLVDPDLRTALIETCHREHIVAVDLMGQLLHQFAQHLDRAPLGEPGRYRHLRQDDLRRIEAIEFAVEHDDGKRAYELSKAEIVLIGLSRVGKTPVSVYLATLGWKVANVPLAREMRPPDELFEVDKRRIVGLQIDPGQLVRYRRERGKRLGFGERSEYSAPSELVDEGEYATSIFRRGGFHVIDMTDKPIEEGADEVVAAVRRRLS
jgi:regulator of PEP synthase PpsR (kinase-PPPase family)